MKKRFFAALLFISSLYAQNIETYLYSVDMDYREYDSYGHYLDGDYTDYGDLNGIGVLYSDGSYSVNFKLLAEFASGSSTYKGQTWAGDPLTLTKKNVYIFNLQGLLAPFKNYFYVGLGFREWQRGKSDYAGDYDETYYWPYLSFAYKYDFRINYRFYLKPSFEYQLAINPKLDVELGSGTTLNLGTTTGLKAELKAGYIYSDNVSFTFFYRYQYWHISKSSPSEIVLNGDTVSIYEPESFTRNQYLGVGIDYRY